MNNFINTGLLPVMMCGVLLLAGCGSGMPDWKQASEYDTGPRVTEAGITFSLFAPRAAKVNLAGDFNNWSTGADPMYNREGRGVWTVTIPLPPGRYEYKFLLDGERWIPDPGNTERVDDGFGGVNAVVVVQ